MHYYRGEKKYWHKRKEEKKSSHMSQILYVL